MECWTSGNTPTMGWVMRRGEGGREREEGEREGREKEGREADGRERGREKEG